MADWPRQFGIVLLTLSCGCVSVGNPLRIAERSAPSPKTAKHNLDPDAETAAEKTDSALAGRDPATPPRHDPTTRMLIDKELSDATPEERAEWLAYLGGVTADKVPYILRARRIEVDRRRAQLAQTNSKSDVVPAGHDATGEKPEIRPVSVEADHEASGAHAARSNRLWTFAEFDRQLLWNRTSAEGQPTNEKPERSGFGLNRKAAGEVKTLSTVEPPEVVVSRVDPVAAVVPEVRLTPGAELWEDELQKLLSLLEAETSAASGQSEAVGLAHVRQQVTLRMLHLVANEPQRALQVIPGLPPAEQEFWSTLFLGLTQYFDDKNITDPSERATLAIQQLRTAAHQLQHAAKLQLRTVTFCEQINSFGNYDPFDSDEFRPGQPLLIYAEVRNFSSEPTVSGFYRTRIKSTVEIFRSGINAELVDQNTFDATEDLCRTLRSDYYHSYRIDLPGHLAPGPYLLKLSIEDELTGKSATETLGFTVK